VWVWRPWLVLSPRTRDVGPNGRDALDSRATVTNKVMDTGASTQELVNTIAQGMSVQQLNL
jgi:hypothetical protein